MSALDDLARILAERELDVGDLIRQAEDDARADVAETLRRLFADDLLRRVGQTGSAGSRWSPSPESPTAVGRSYSISLRAISTTRLGSSVSCGRTTSSCSARSRRGPSCPFRFGTTFPDRAALDEWLERHRAALAAELERLRGTAEWSVEPVGRVPDVDAAEYLGARLATTVRPGLRERLAAACEDAAGDAYLVAKSRQDEFAAAVAELEAEGYELRVTGPWPPYSFARLP